MSKVSEGNETRKIEDASGKVANGEAKDFETAIEACGFGIFNICLLLVSAFGISATVFETSSMSYILPTAECDLHLSLMDKGVLNAITYAGMILSAIPWGYIADTMGRKKVLVYGLLADGLFVLIGAISTHSIQLLVCRFLGGFSVGGPFAVIMSYLSELHGKQHRSRVMMIIGLMKTSALLILPLLAYLILPYHILIYILGIRFHTWQIYVVATAVPALLSGSLLALFPESPKFLMSQGRNAEALKTFQTIYAINKRKPEDTYPIKMLLDEAPEKTAKRTSEAEANSTGQRRRSLRDRGQMAKTSFLDGLKQLKPMFKSPYLHLSLLVYLMHFCILLSQNSIRFWLPQIFASIEEYEYKGLGASSMCKILEYNVNKSELIKPVLVTDENCDNHISPASYTNNMIVAASGFVGFLIAGTLVNFIGNKAILSICLGLSGICGTSLYWSTSALSTLIISSMYVTLCSVATTTVISTSVSIFPTSMRTMVIVLILTCGRLGSLLGNILFPFFIALGCIPPFILIGSAMLSACVISLFIPSTHKTALT